VWYFNKFDASSSSKKAEAENFPLSKKSYTLHDRQNYLRTKRQREMAYGQAGSLLKYFQDKMAENPLFQYALQMDCEEQISNIFWADTKRIMDNAQFGNVVSFDTTFGTNKER